MDESYSSMPDILIQSMFMSMMWRALESLECARADELRLTYVESELNEQYSLLGVGDSVQDRGMSILCDSSSMLCLSLFHVTQ
jgi:hypothetical protein